MVWENCTVEYGGFAMLESQKGQANQCVEPNLSDLAKYPPLDIGISS
jgi:hypothetical protein